ncbi:hypothetical protein [Pseudomonas shahriarae]|uniref:hypothetical protein n=1 Tax=Pseudomonas shahriarae TaxID=2745512 RepID=UPI00236244EE|nr:hypothetical protein [Pseudomonas shahriarae]MDD1134648.1 hypothetical protein [Pseudomonas shahriarae]
MTRDDLSFTGRIVPNEHLLCNWLPIEVPRQINQWNIARSLGLSMIDEIVALHRDSEEGAHSAISCALISENWRAGGFGTETGFAEGIANLAVVGMRYLQRGATPCVEPGVEGAHPWTAQELIARGLQDAKKQKGILFDAYSARQQGSIATLFNLGLIDRDAYNNAYQEINNLIEKRRGSGGVSR